MVENLQYIVSDILYLLHISTIIRRSKYKSDEIFVALKQQKSP